MSRMFSIRDRDYAFLKGASDKSGEPMSGVLSSALDIYRTHMDLNAKYRGRLGEVGDIKQDLANANIEILRLQAEIERVQSDALKVQSVGTAKLRKRLYAIYRITKEVI